MVLPPLPGENLPHPVRQPVFEVAFGGPAGGLASAASETIGVDLGGGTTDPWQRTVVTLVVEAGLAPAADVMKIDLAADDQAPAVAVGDTGSVYLGYADEGTALVLPDRSMPCAIESAGQRVSPPPTAVRRLPGYG